MTSELDRARLRAAPAATLPLRVLALAMGIALAGCAAGPDFRSPTLPEGKGYRAGALPEATVATDAPTGDAQRFLDGADVPERWWTAFGNDELDRRVERALAHSPSIASAQAALRQAQENVNASRGSLLPSVDANLGVTRGNQNAVDGNAFTLHNAGVSVGYTLDLFGGVRRGVEAQSALADYQEFQLQGTYLSLAGNVTTASFREASLRGQIQATEEVIKLYDEQLKVVERQHEIGAKSLGDVLAIRTQAATSRALLPSLRQQLGETQNQIAVYLGQFPSEAEFAALELDALDLPREVPLSLPSEVARQRPDIRAAEAQLHRATADLGVATANLYPQITLSGSLGSQARDAGDLFSSGSKVWGIGANLLQPLFHGGTLRAQKRAAEAGLDKAAADYQQTLLGAFQNVSDALRALELDAENLKAQAEAENSASRSLDLVRGQYKEGAASYLQMLDATRQYQQTRIGLIQARAARLADTAALYAALGGGWQGEVGKLAAASVASK
ncbi:efflux transporter outer membrane subunit [Dokdonella sp.]|uniref:efflux transporter outer membrane subunit n=1 Tax=Dokdonella sp. TaxID=2291710 RepID=UPI001B144F04|nr:efflux transporter outer membrane subunit [Dokdonella sp.]MBO9661726.1 efflux transporter outer membrane subunit [Dokdonella sp.]